MPRSGGLELVDDAVEDRGDGPAERRQGDDDHEGDEDQDQAVLDHALAALAVASPSHQATARLSGNSVRISSGTSRPISNRRPRMRGRRPVGSIDALM